MPQRLLAKPSQRFALLPFRPGRRMMELVETDYLLEVNVARQEPCQPTW